jgi:hypothetical protein
MKIIQLVAAMNGEAPGHFESPILGLGDDGNLYQLIEAYPSKVLVNGRYADDEAVKKHMKEGNMPTFRDGTTQGWQLICMSIDRPKALPHPLDPTRNERS